MRKEPAPRSCAGAKRSAIRSSKTSLWWNSRPTKSRSEVPAPVSGTLIEVLKAVDAEVNPDEVLARMRLAGESVSPVEIGTSGVTPKIDTPAAARAAGGSHSGDQHEPLSPSVRRLLREHSIAAGDINGTGRNGRVTAQDVTRHVSRTQVPRASLPKTARESAAEAANTLVPHTAIRRRVAEHMVRSLLDAPHVTTLFEVDLTRVLKHRSLHALELSREVRD